MGGGGGDRWAVVYYIELISLDILQIQASRVLPGFLAVDEAYAM